MHRFSYSTFRRWARPLLGYLAIILAMTMFGSTLVRPTSVAKAQDSDKASQQQAAPEAPSATFPGTGTGAIPDGTSLSNLPAYGASRVVSFNVAGASGSLTDISANFTINHSFVGDIDVVLAAPGGSPSMVLVSRIGVTTAASFGSGSDYAGTYGFADVGALPTNIWTAAATTPVPVGTYRTTAAGGPGQTNPAPVTSLLPTFGGLTPGQINGTWTLTFRDGCQSDTGSVTAANLNLSFPQICTTAKRPLDFDGDSKTDPTVTRNTGGGPTGQETWYIQPSGGGGPVTVDWGINGDFFVPGDYDGDGKQDIAVWRGGTPGNSYWYILKSSTNTLQSYLFGQSGDDPTVVGDYDGDGKVDPAVYRAGAGAGSKSNWYWIGSVDGLQHGYEFGQNGDYPAPGDYDGDFKNDFAVQRDGGGGGAIFFLQQTTAGPTAVWFGTPTDIITPGYYDTDCKTDIAVTRGISGSIIWFIRNSTDASTSTYAFGQSATDYRTQGDWDGDGKTDIGVWRPNADPSLNFFYWVRSIDNTLGAAEWGSNGDYPVANFNSH